MRRSKQEICRDILKVLALEGALNSTHLAHKVKVSHHILNACLRYLCQQGFVEKRSLKNKAVYAATKEGWNIIKKAELFYPHMQIFEVKRSLIIER